MEALGPCNGTGPEPADLTPAAALQQFHLHAADTPLLRSVLKGCFCVGGEPYCSTLPLFLIVSHTFVITQAVNFIFYSSQ